VASLFRRQSPAPVEPVVEDSAAPVLTSQPRSLTPKKGEATPKRPSANRRVAEPVPANRKEAATRSRERSRQVREESRRGMMAGEERYLLPKDKGPVRRLARNVVDSRFNVATVLFFGLFAILFLSMGIFPTAVRSLANAALLFLVLATLFDNFLVVRKVRKLAAERIPKETQGMRGLYFYTVMRGISIRRLRIPKPQVKVGDKI
jgi:hypothetical protein